MCFWLSTACCVTCFTEYLCVWLVARTWRSYEIKWSAECVWRNVCVMICAAVRTSLPHMLDAALHNELHVFIREGRAGYMKYKYCRVFTVFRVYDGAETWWGCDCGYDRPRGSDPSSPSLLLLWCHLQSLSGFLLTQTEKYSFLVFTATRSERSGENILQYFVAQWKSVFLR